MDTAADARRDWGSSYMLIKIGIRDLSPAMVAWSRVALAALMLAARLMPAARWRDSAPRSRPWCPATTQVAAPFLLISAGEQEILLVADRDPGQLNALFTALLATGSTRRSAREACASPGSCRDGRGRVLLGVDLGGDGIQLLGGLAVLLASLGYAVGPFMVKHRLVEGPPIGIVAWAVVTSTVLLAPAAVIGFPEAARGPARCSRSCAGWRPAPGSPS